MLGSLKCGMRKILECSIIPGLSPDFESFKQYEEKLSQVCENIHQDLNNFPSIKFGIESALLDLKNGGKQIYFTNDFSLGNKQIDINGLVWMGDVSFMQAQVKEKLSQGFTTIKMKIGAIDFDNEISILKGIRTNHSVEEITLRVDANGAFTKDDALNKLNRLNELGIHSIEQPIKAGQWDLMAKLCKTTPIPIALDEELIGVNDLSQKIELLEKITPQYIILKPSLHGGISGTREWIELAETRSIPWWITSALESNVGLKTICELCAEYDNPLPQGLGTGSLYTNNIKSDLHVSNGRIFLH